MFNKLSFIRRASDTNSPTMTEAHSSNSLIHQKHVQNICDNFSSLLSFKRHVEKVIVAKQLKHFTLIFHTFVHEDKGIRFIKHYNKRMPV